MDVAHYFGLDMKDETIIAKKNLADIWEDMK